MIPTRGYTSYFLATVSAVFFAFYISSLFVRPAKSQSENSSSTQNEGSSAAPPSGSPPAPNAAPDAPVPPAATTAVPSNSPPAASPSLPTESPKTGDLPSSTPDFNGRAIKGSEEDFTYDPTAGRDPFKPYRQIIIDPKAMRPSVIRSGNEVLEPLQLIEIEKLAVVGILWDVNSPRALLMEKGTGKTYSVGVNSKIGRRNGFVRLIREGEVIVIESETIDGNTVKSTKVLELKR